MPHQDRAQGLRVGIIGTGGISHQHAPGWLEQGVDLHCYSHSGAEAFAEQYGATVHQTLDELLAAVDVADVCTPTPPTPRSCTRPSMPAATWCARSR